jgi:hypothetical protein
MLSPDTTVDIGACLARISALEDERRAALMLSCGTEDGATIRAITAQQQADALAFARRATL